MVSSQNDSSQTGTAHSANSDSSILQQVEAIAHSWAFANLSSSLDRIELTGADRAKFLHNLCTADIVKLPPQTGSEAFFLNAKGKTIDYGLVYAVDDSLWIDLEAGRAPSMIKHLERYLFREKVDLHDQSATFAHLHFVGPGLPSQLPVDLASPSMSVTSIDWDDIPVQVRRRDRSLSPGFDWVIPTEALSEVLDRVRSQGAVELAPETLESLRIEAGLPRFGMEVTEDNLAQELGRDSQAISFNKGCYIGQETVARLDALGHVNKLLRGIVFPIGSAVEAKQPVQSQGKTIGVVASVADRVLVPRDGTTPSPSRISLAVLRLAGGMPGDHVTVPTSQGDCEGVVVALPFSTA